jgi:hypothetical protein
MLRGILSTLVTAIIAGAIGFGAGAYVSPTEHTLRFRELVNNGLAAIDDVLHRERTSDAEHNNAAPTASIETETAPKESPSETSMIPPVSEPPASDAAPVAEAPQSETVPASPAVSDSSPTPPPTVNAEVAPAPAAKPSTPEGASKDAVVAKHAKPPVKKPPPKKKPVQHPTNNEPAEPAAGGAGAQ